MNREKYAHYEDYRTGYEDGVKDGKRQVLDLLKPDVNLLECHIEDILRKISESVKE